MESQAEYERRSLLEAHRHMKEIETQPLADRKEAQASFLEAMRDPALVGERIGWLIDGNYGYGEMLQAKRIVSSPRMNRRAALVHLVGAYEWQSPPTMTISAWKKLSAAEKKALDATVDIVIAEAEKEIAGG